MARPSSITESIEKELLDLYAMGYCDGEIAQKISVSRYAVVRYRKAHGLRANRSRGDRGLGRPREDESYYLYTQRILKNPSISSLMHKTVAKLLRLGRITAETAFVVFGMEPARLIHLNPPPYAQDPAKMTFAVGQKIAKIEQFIERAGIAGVPGQAIIELAKVIKTADEAEKERLAELAVMEAGFVTSSATVGGVTWYVSSIIPMQEYIAKWNEELEQIREFTKNAPEKLRRGFAFAKASGGRINRTGKKGKQGGVINIAARTAWIGVAGY